MQYLFCTFSFNTWFCINKYYIYVCMIHDFVSISSIFMKDHKANNAENVFKNNQSKILNVFISWRTMEPPLRHIHSRSLPLESADKLPNVSSCIQDTTYFAVVLADDSGGKSCHLFLLFYYWRAAPSIKPCWCNHDFRTCQIESCSLVVIRSHCITSITLLVMIRIRIKIDIRTRKIA